MNTFNFLILKNFLRKEKKLKSNWQSVWVRHSLFKELLFKPSVSLADHLFKFCSNDRNYVQNIDILLWHRHFVEKTDILFQIIHRKYKKKFVIHRIILPHPYKCTSFNGTDKKQTFQKSKLHFLVKKKQVILKNI